MAKISGQKLPTPPYTTKWNFPDPLYIKRHFREPYTKNGIFKPPLYAKKGIFETPYTKNDLHPPPFNF